MWPKLLQFFEMLMGRVVTKGTSLRVTLTASAFTVTIGLLTWLSYEAKEIDHGLLVLASLLVGLFFGSRISADGGKTYDNEPTTDKEEK